MPSDPAPTIRMEIGHVLFIDIVGYSMLLINEQTEVLQKLNELVRGTERVRAAESANKLIRLPSGDGMALAFRDNPEAPAECALEISQALKSHTGIGVRMGIHSGPVNEVVDVNERANIAGGGINVTSPAQCSGGLSRPGRNGRVLCLTGKSIRRTRCPPELLARRSEVGRGPRRPALSIPTPANRARLTNERTGPQSALTLQFHRGESGS